MPMFGRGSGFGQKLGFAGDILTGNPATQNRVNAQQANDTRLLGMQNKLDLAQYKAVNHPDTPIIANAKAIGLIPGTPEFTKFVTDAQMKQGLLVLGSADTGQTVVDPNALRGGMGAQPQAPAPPPAAIAQLRSNQALASQFDEVFGPGAAARALGGQ